jgi:hypothetical protein
MLQNAPGSVFALKVASSPGLTGEVTESILSDNSAGLMTTLVASESLRPLESVTVKV